MGSNCHQRQILHKYIIESTTHKIKYEFCFINMKSFYSVKILTRVKTQVVNKMLANHISFYHSKYVWNMGRSLNTTWEEMDLLNYMKDVNRWHTYFNKQSYGWIKQSYQICLSTLKIIEMYTKINNIAHILYYLELK